MSYKVPPIQPVPGQQYSISLNQGVNAIAIDFWNATPFDIDYSGFGVMSDTTIIAGTGMRYFAKDFNTGSIKIVANNNTGSTSTGVINITVYQVGDTIPQGQFPVTIPVQQVNAIVSGVQTLSNEGDTVGTEIIDIGTAANNKLIDIFNNHFKLSIEIGGVAHTILQGSITGSPGQAGQAGDVFEMLGQLLVDQIAIFSAGMKVNTIEDLSGVTQATLTATEFQVPTAIKTNLINNAVDDTSWASVSGTSGSIDTRIQASHQVRLQVPGGTDAMVLGTTSSTSNQDLIAATNFALGASAFFAYRNGNKEHNIGSTNNITGTGTVNHNVGETPFDGYITCQVSGSETVGYDTLTSTTAHVTLGAALSAKAIWRV